MPTHSDRPRDHAGEGISLSHCGISPLFPGAAAAARRWDDHHQRLGAGVFRELGDPTVAVHRAAAALLGVAPTDLSFLRNTAEGLSLVANGLPLAPGDRLLSYVHEYPANHYPWRLQEARGARLDLLPDRPGGSDVPAGQPRAFALEDLEQHLRAGGVRAVALSHVQFTSGFTADLPAIGQLCRAHGAWFIVDAAQSLGALPLRPAEWGVDALAASGWKWLRGPIGTGLLYTSPRLRAELRHTMAGADLMEQGEDYLNHTWRPHTDGQRFEYGTASMSQAAALAACLEEFQLRLGPDAILALGARWRALLRTGLDAKYFHAADFPDHGGPILSWRVTDPEAVVRRAAAQGVTVTVRGGYLRTAPHAYQTEAEMHQAIAVLNQAAHATQT